eukprot:1384155-Amorphochlora_amoeboformis.AAC.1
MNTQPQARSLLDLGAFFFSKNELDSARQQWNSGIDGIFSTLNSVSDVIYSGPVAIPCNYDECKFYSCFKDNTDTVLRWVFWVDCVACCGVTLCHASSKARYYRVLPDITGSTV